MNSKIRTIAVACFCVSSILPATAEPVRRIVTTGPVQEVAGWEKNLCGGDRNLNSWFWIPIRKQPINIRYEGGNQNTQDKQEYAHSVPTRSYRDYLPKKVMPYVAPKAMPTAGCGPNNSSSDVRASLVNPSLNGKLLARRAPAMARANRAPTEYSYGGSYSHAAAGGSSIAATSNCVGRLLHSGS